MATRSCAQGQGRGIGNDLPGAIGLSARTGRRCAQHEGVEAGVSAADVWGVAGTAGTQQHSDGPAAVTITRHQLMSLCATSGLIT